MVDQVQIPHTVVAGKAPLPAELIEGGLAVNLKDFTLYSKGYDNVVIRLTGVVFIEDDEDTNVSVYLPWVRGAGAGMRQYTSSAKLSFNPATGELRATSFSGSGAGLTGLTAEQVEDALGFEPVQRAGGALPPVATDLASAIALVNGLRAALVSAGLGT